MLKFLGLLLNPCVFNGRQFNKKINAAAVQTQRAVFLILKSFNSCGCNVFKVLGAATHLLDHKTGHLINALAFLFTHLRGILCYSVP